VTSVLVIATGGTIAMTPAGDGRLLPELTAVAAGADRARVAAAFAVTGGQPTSAVWPWPDA